MKVTKSSWCSEPQGTTHINLCDRSFAILVHQIAGGKVALEIRVGLVSTDFHMTEDQFHALLFALGTADRELRVVWIEDAKYGRTILEHEVPFVQVTPEDVNS